MRKHDDALVTRSRIAELAGVHRPAVTNWAARYPDFPQAVDSRTTATGKADLFRADEIAAWLRKRRIPAPALRDGELPGTTYGDRFLAALDHTHRPSPMTVVSRLLEERGGLRRHDHLDLLIALVYLYGGGAADFDPRERPWVTQNWSRLRDLLVHDGVWPPRQLDGRGDVTSTQRIEQVLRATVPVLGEASWDRESAAEAFDHLVELRMEVEERAGGILTPPSLRRLMAGLLPGAGPVLDPYCRTGELLEACVVADRGRDGEEGGGADTTGTEVLGVSEDEDTAALARMRLRVRGVDPELREWGALPLPSGSPGERRFARVATNPPFNRKAGSRGWDPRALRYGVPPANNGNFVWLQAILSTLAPEGRAAVLMPDIAAQSTSPAEREIRRHMIEDGAVEALIALPAQLFGRATGVRAMLWLLTAPTGRGDEVLFVDAESLGTMKSRVRRELSRDDVDTLIDTCDRWRAARAAGEPFPGRKGFSVSVPVAEIARHGHVLTPALYVPWDVTPRHGPAGRETVDRLIAELDALDGAARLADERAARSLRTWRERR
ncbi:N-6 DNA methylase [Streptomyces sp. NPDC006339]|uniref:N-6 DNA methylase n=1 Tax=Streptomyces sp. NPDC006339 TaxID=3156755 RepID=UPI0033A372F4